MAHSVLLTSSIFISAPIGGEEQPAGKGYAKSTVIESEQVTVRTAIPVLRENLVLAGDASEPPSIFSHLCHRCLASRGSDADDATLGTPEKKNVVACQLFNSQKNNSKMNFVGSGRLFSKEQFVHDRDGSIDSNILSV